MLWPHLVRWLLALLLVGFTLGTMWRLAVALRALWGRVATSFGEDTGSRVIGFGLSAVCFPAALQVLVGWLWHLAVALLFTVPASLVGDAEFEHEIKELGGSGAVSHLMARASIALAKVFGPYEGGVVPIAQIALLLALWALLGRLQQAAPTADGQPRTRLRRLYEAIGEARWRDLALFLLLAVGTFLSIASITALPELAHPGALPPSVSVDRLRTRLNELSLDDVQFNKRYPDKPFAYDPFEALRKVIDQRRGDATLDTSAKANLTSAINDLDYQERLRQQVAASWTDLRDAAQTELKRARDDGASKYESNVDRVGVRQTTDHFHDIDQWYSHQQLDWQHQLGACRTKLQSMDQAWASWSSGEQQALSANNTADEQRLSSVGLNLTLSLGEAHQACDARPAVDQVPARRPLGDNLGVVGFIARWLLDTESLPLTLIVGMLGFGLLGSAVSSFVRQRAQRQPGQPLVADLGAVVIRGLSAAMVVFLAVEGGLAVFSTGDNPPSPYMLLFTCLVAAAYSGDVWSWARRRALADLGDPESK